MTLVDTSVWVDHIDHGIQEMHSLLLENAVTMHAFVIGELALGNLKRRKAILDELGDLPDIQVATTEEVLRFIDLSGLHGRGIGYVDAHLLASVRITPGCLFWTRDKSLRAAATQLGIASPLD